MSKVTAKFSAGDYFETATVTDEQYHEICQAMISQGFEEGEYEGGTYEFRDWGHFGVHICGEIYHSDGVKDRFKSLRTVDEVYESTTKDTVEEIQKEASEDVYKQFFMESVNDLTIYHFRKYDSEGNVLSQGGGTVVFTLLPKSGEVLMGISACSKEDNFDRKAGVTIAKSRLKKTGQFLDKVPAKHEVKAFIGRYCDEDTKRIFKSF